MNQLPYSLYQASQVQTLDKMAIQRFGTPGIELMNRAGAATFDLLCQRWPDAREIVVVCGAGNNAGDGYVVARLAQERNFQVTILALVDPAELRGDAKRAWGAAQAAGLHVSDFDADRLNHADVIVDAILGTGLDRPVEGRWADAIKAINHAVLPVLAVDIPSGLHADSGVIMGQAIQAEATISFVGLKQGMLTADGVDHCGVIQFDDLDVNPAVYEEVKPSCQRVDWSSLKPMLPPRLRSAHKGQQGHTLIVGGNYGMAGAVRLTAEAALRSGSGLTSVATRPEHTASMAAARPEVMWRGVNSANELQALIQRASVIAIGPGLGQDAWAKCLLETVLQSKKPLVVDADALTLLAGDFYQRSDWVLTPHPGEAARLLSCTTDDIHQQRFDAVKRMAEKYHAVVVLKGAGSLIQDTAGATALCSDGNPGMASGGMGDALTGIIAALAAQGVALADAARMGVCLHAAAADKVAENGMRGMTAGDVIAALPRLLN